MNQIPADITGDPRLTNASDSGNIANMSIRCRPSDDAINVSGTGARSCFSMGPEEQFPKKPPCPPRVPVDHPPPKEERHVVKLPDDAITYGSTPERA